MLCYLDVVADTRAYWHCPINSISILNFVLNNNRLVACRMSGILPRSALIAAGYHLRVHWASVRVDTRKRVDLTVPVTWGLNCNNQACANSKQNLVFKVLKHIPKMQTHAVCRDRDTALHTLPANTLCNDIARQQAVFGKVYWLSSDSDPVATSEYLAGFVADPTLRRRGEIALSQYGDS